MVRAHKAAATFILLTAVCLAQGSVSSDQETIRLLVQQVKDLQAKVAALEGAQPRPTLPVENSAASADTDSQERNATTHASLDGLPLHDLRGIQWRGFGEVNYKVLDQRQPELETFGSTPGSAGNFYTGDLDLLLTSRISDKSSVLSEIVFGEGEAQTFDVDLERLLFKYEYNDHLKMSFGRYHTGVGYYNATFHTGKWVHTTADRPLIMEFAADGGLLPTHAIGLSVTGLIPSGKLGLNYLLEYGSSDTVRPAIDGSGVEIDENNGNHVTAGLFLRPDNVPGLQIGGAVYHDNISDFSLGPNVRLGQSILNAHAVYTGHHFEILNEVFLIRHSYEGGGPVFDMPAFYSQWSKAFGHVRPFFRYQYVNMNPNSILRDASLRHGPSFGARYDINDNIAFKLQLDHTVRKGKPDLNGLQTQLAFTF